MEASFVTEQRAARRQTRREERANALSHGLGFVGAAASWPLLADLAAAHGGPMAAWGVGIFCLSAMLVFAASMVYHALPPGRAKHVAHRCDHAAIFVYIAGSYTPFALGPLREHGGVWVLALVWSVAAFGVLAKLAGRLSRRWASIGVYLAMGWLGAALLDPLTRQAGDGAVQLLLAGGGAYSIGAVFFVFDHRLRYGHFVWHLCVLGGSVCHLLAAVGPNALLR